MAENDIYNNQKKYETFKNSLDSLVKEPTKNNKRKYWIKNPVNLKYYKQLFTKFEARDISYIGRLRILRTFLIATYVLDFDVAKANRDDIDKVMAYSHSVNKTVKSKKTFVTNIRAVWKDLFPEKDSQGRIDDTIYPYVVRHLSNKVDKSKEKLRGDKFSLNEFELLVQSFAQDSRMQALLTLAFESLGRPQELLHRKIRDVEIFDNYAKIYITEHGKEGTGFLRCIDSYPYLAKWMNEHPLKSNKNSFLFINLGRVNKYKQMTPFAANKLIRERCKVLGIEKPITLYSLKRNGVTAMRLQGKSDLDIQHTARWTSSKQLKTYDLSNQEESFMIELIKRGKIEGDGKYKDLQPTTKTCLFCGTENGLAETMCAKCKRPLDRKVIEAEAKKTEEEIASLRNQMSNIEKALFALASKDPRAIKLGLKEVEELKKKK